MSSNFHNKFSFDNKFVNLLFLLQQIHGVNGVPLGGRGRPASVDIDTTMSQNSQTNQLISRRNAMNQGK